jgi:hypothetical protein
MTRRELVSALRVLREDATIVKISDRARRIDIHFTEGGKTALLVIPKPPPPKLGRPVGFDKNGKLIREPV